MFLYLGGGVRFFFKFFSKNGQMNIPLYGYRGWRSGSSIAILGMAQNDHFLYIWKIDFLPEWAISYIIADSESPYMKSLWPNQPLDF